MLLTPSHCVSLLEKRYIKEHKHFLPSFNLLFSLFLLLLIACCFYFSFYVGVVGEVRRACDG